MLFSSLFYFIPCLAERSLRHAGLQLSRKEWNLKIATCIEKEGPVIVSVNEAGGREWIDVQEGQLGLSRSCPVSVAASV